MSVLDKSCECRLEPIPRSEPGPNNFAIYSGENGEEKIGVLIYNRTLRMWTINFEPHHIVTFDFIDEIKSTLIHTVD